MSDIVNNIIINNSKATIVAKVILQRTPVRTTYFFLVCIKTTYTQG